MFGFPPAVAAAVIASFVAFLTVIINVFSAQFVRRQERSEKHHEWVREKQVRDVEEIIPTLNGFLKDLSDVAQRMDSHQSLVNFLLNLNLDGRQKYTSDPDYLSTSKAEVVNTLEENLKKLGEDALKLSSLASIREPWFDFRAESLSIWFDAKDEMKKNLSAVSTEFQQYHLAIVQTSSKMNTFFFWLSTRKGELTDEDIAKSAQLNKDFKRALEERSELKAAVMSLQKRLVDKFKPLSSQPAPSHGDADDGLLVQTARWAEKKLRQLLQLR